MHGFQLIMNFLIMPLFFLSGSIFPLSNLPAPILLFAKLNPLSYGVDGIRWALIGANQFPVLLSLGVVSLVSIAFIGIGAFLFSKIQV